MDDVKFMIGDRETTAREMLIVIPLRYADMFVGKRFKDANELSMAVMYARCAQEGRLYNRPWIVKENEVALACALERK